MIAQGFGFTRDFLQSEIRTVIPLLQQIPCESKEQARARHPGEKCGLDCSYGDTQFSSNREIVKTDKYPDTGGISAHT